MLEVNRFRTNYTLAVFFVIFLLNMKILAQWNNEWSSPQIESGVISGWLNFQQSGNDWQARIYVIDSLAFSIMQAGYTLTPQYIYSFSSQEKLAGNQIYSLGVDLNGDNITEFYVLGYEGTGSPYRQSFKIIDIINNNILIQLQEFHHYPHPKLKGKNKRS